MTFETFLSQPDIKTFIRDIDAKLSNETRMVYPPKDNRFLALQVTPLNQIKVVILGQDPYHGEGQAHGLAFSCLTHPLPPSLKNIFKAVKMQYGHTDDQNGDLTRWAKQGVLLWNVYLSVVEKKPLSHTFKSYEMITKRLLETISETQKHVVFMLWGSFAQSFKSFIKGDHLIIETVHPSPLSVYRGFYEANVFLKANAYVEKHHQKEIDWT